MSERPYEKTGRIKQAKEYFETHFAASFILLLAVVILIMLLVFQGYLKREYFHYLVEQSYKTEDAVMESVQRNVRYSLKELINEGSEMATRYDLLQLTQKADMYTSESPSIAGDSLHLYNTLSDYDYLNNVTAAAVVSQNGLINQYDKYRSGSYPLLWSGDNLSIIEEKAKYLLDDVSKGDMPRFMVFTEPSRYEKNLNVGIFHVAYPLTGGKLSIDNTKYVLVISYSMETFTEFINTVEVPQVKYIQGYIADKDGKIIYHKNESDIGKEGATLLENEGMGLITKEVGYFGWTLNTILDEQEMKRHVDMIYNRGVWLYIFLLILFVIVMTGFMNKLLRPVHQISEALSVVERGNYHARIQIKGKHEIWQMAEEYNKMIQAIESKNVEIEKQHKEKLLSIERQHQAEREALESQINAHFICNTLGCINYEAIEGGNHQVSILIKKLSNILRYSFDQKCQVVYIYQEIAWIDQYLYLQKTRYETVFDYGISFPDEYNHWPCCKLMFQPFVENSILHGFEGRESGGLININAEAEGERLKIVIRDNGCGIDSQTTKVIEEILEEKGRPSLENRGKTGIGIRNVVTRMYMYYGDNLSISMRTEKEKGTEFTFRIPIPKHNSEA